MTLIVEDGTAPMGAESYNTIAEIKDYADARGLIFAIADDDEALAEQAARRGAAWLDAAYRKQFPGYRTNQRDQSLEWPRTEAYDFSTPPAIVPVDEIPVEVKQAHCEASIREKAAPGALSPDVTPGKIKTEVSVSGAVAVKYANAGIDGQRPISTVIDDILGTLVSINRAPKLFGKAVRG